MQKQRCFHDIHYTLLQFMDCLYSWCGGLGYEEGDGEMSREIKFRAWDGELMHEVSELHFCMGPNLDGKGLKFYGPGVGSGWIDGKSIHLMQFTGLHDKNGTPIYEGDIIEYPDYSGGAYIFGKQPLARAAVKWNKDTGGYRVPGTGYSFPAGKCEVIGNIFENKDLLS